MKHKTEVSEQPGSRVNVYLYPEDDQYLKQVGDGNRSEGIRRLVLEARRRKWGQRK